MNEIIIVLAGLLSFLIVGVCVLGLFRFNTTFLETLGLAFGIGGGVVSLELFVLSYANLPINVLSVFLPWYILFIYFVFNRKLSYKKNNDADGFVPFDYFFILLIFFCTTLAVVYALIQPVSSWDAIATWSMLAKGFYFERSLSGDFYRFFNFENPPVVSLQQSFLSILIGSYNDKAVMLLYPAYFISLVALFYTFVKKFSTKTNALIFTFLLSSLPLVLGQAGRNNTGYIDLALAYFIFSSVILLYYYFKFRTIEHALLLGFVLGLTALVKNEGLSILLIISGIVLLINLRKKRFRDVVYLLLGLLPFFIWKVYEHTENFPQHPLYGGAFVPERIVSILTSFGAEFLKIGKWNLLWAPFILSLFLLVRTRFINLVLLIVFLQLAFYFIIYLITPANLNLHINSTLDRFLLQLSPLIVFIIAYVFAKPSTYK